MKCPWNLKPPQSDELVVLFYGEILRNRTKEKTVQEQMAHPVPLMFFTFHPPAYGRSRTQGGVMTGLMENNWS